MTRDFDTQRTGVIAICCNTGSWSRHRAHRVVAASEHAGTIVLVPE
jgi:hypothetical protein